MESGFSEVLNLQEDYRRLQGQRYSFHNLFLMVLMGTACGYGGCRPLGNFVASRKEILQSMLDLPHGVPSYGTFHNFFKGLAHEALIRGFNLWASQFVDMEEKEVLNGDGKALRSRVIAGSNSGQNFSQVVSLFCKRSGLVVALGGYQNKKESEIEVMKTLLQWVKGKGVIFSLDALDCQKKP
ncbi:MAG: ISAs1 family transposase [Bacteroidia bacterium]|nr:ISAs1 family transposase [Bacteroidia bacterium]